MEGEFVELPPHGLEKRPGHKITYSSQVHDRRSIIIPWGKKERLTHLFPEALQHFLS
jgi:hypothetical protein